MPIQFVCPGCQQSILARDEFALRWVRCPKCREVLVVPAESAGAKTAADGGSQTALPAEPAAEPVARDVEVVSESEAAAARAVAAPKAEAPTDSQQIAVPRWMLYAHAGLLTIVAVMAFWAGVWVGHTGPERRVEQPLPAAPSPPPEPSVPLTVEVVGKLTWKGAAGEVPDRGATVIVLPMGKRPAKKLDGIDVMPIRPRPPVRAVVQAIEDLGGGYARTGDDGWFTLSIAPGQYRVILVSRHAERLSGVKVRKEDLDVTGEYFALPGTVFGVQKYRVSVIDLQAGSEINHSFGESGKP